MRIIKVADYERLSQQAARILEHVIRNKPCPVLGLATGSTPIGLYKQLIHMHEQEGLDFSSVTTFNLDEYVGLSPDHPNSYHYFMNRNLFSHVNIPSNHIHIPRGDEGQLDLICDQYERSIAEAGGIDIQILGVGDNGHIGFNEPGADFNGRTQVVSLAESTIIANSRFFPSINQVPRKAVSMGIQSILNSKQIVLLASGETKAEAIRRMVQEQVSEQMPASCLKLHSNVIVVVDELAGKWITSNNPQYHT
jgi:glucosamine-6-phosphate deaminase